MITLKTIQEHLREIDRAQLIEEYHYRIRDRIAEEYLNVEHSELADLTLEDGKVGLLYLYDRITDALDYGTEPCCVFVRLDDVREHGADAQNYAYDLYAQSAIMGFLVSDDEYTQQKTKATPSTPLTIGSTLTDNKSIVTISLDLVTMLDI